MVRGRDSVARERCKKGGGGGGGGRRRRRRKRGGGNDGHLRSLGSSVHSLTRSPPPVSILSSLCAFNLPGGRQMFAPLPLDRTTLPFSLSLFYAHLLSFLPSFSTVLVDFSFRLLRRFLLALPLSLSLSRRSLFPVQPLGQPTSDILTDSDHSDVRGRRRRRGEGGSAHRW